MGKTALYMPRQQLLHNNVSGDEDRKLAVSAFTIATPPCKRGFMTSQRLAGITWSDMVLPLTVKRRRGSLWGQGGADDILCIALEYLAHPIHH